MVAPYIPENSDILDIGGYDGSFLTHVRGKIKRGVCIDPFIEERKDDKIEFVRYRFSHELPFPDASFDAVTLIAVYEHLQGVREQITAEVSKSSGYRIVSHQLDFFGICPACQKK